MVKINLNININLVFIFLNNKGLKKKEFPGSKNMNSILGKYQNHNLKYQRKPYTSNGPINFDIINQENGTQASGMKGTANFF